MDFASCRKRAIPLYEAELAIVRKFHPSNSLTVKDIGKCYKGEINLIFHKRYLRGDEIGQARLIGGAKREVLFEAARKMSEIDDAMLSHSVVLKEDRAKQKEWEIRTASTEQQLSWSQSKQERLMRWRKASSEFDVSRAFVLIVWSKEASQARLAS